MAFCCREANICKIVINNKIIQVNTSIYLGWSLSYDGEKGIEASTSNFLIITSLISKIFKSTVQKYMRLNIKIL
jgi:hypothetical protein